jgi:bifunctional ADP-heptose synthase (sugar kinase/adenylyltransferase)
MKILDFGHLCIDSNISENASYTSAGSPAIFMNKIFSQLPDIEFTTVASYGKDFLPYAKNLKLYPEKPNLKKSLIYENKQEIGGERVQRAYNRETALPVPIDDKVIALIQEADIIIISPLLSNFLPEYYRNIYNHAKKKTSILLLPQGYFRDFNKDDKVVPRNFTEVDEILPFVDAVTVSFFDQLYMTTVAERWVNKSNVIVIETLSDKGALIISKEGQFHVPTIPMPAVEIVDSVGSGDVFSAAFIFWYKRTRNLYQSVEFANELARQKLSFTPEDIKIDYDKLTSEVHDA